MLRKIASGKIKTSDIRHLTFMHNYIPQNRFEATGLKHIKTVKYLCKICEALQMFTYVAYFCNPPFTSLRNFFENCYQRRKMFILYWSNSGISHYKSV